MSDTIKLCVGNGNAPNMIKCIKINDSHIFPPYCKGPYVKNIGDFTIIPLVDSSTIKIDNSKIIDTTYQCWPTDIKSIHVESDVFLQLLIKLFNSP